MAKVNMADLKSLRERSGAGLKDCKNALIESNGDMDAAIDWLRKKGLVTASKKSGRIASEGLIGIYIEDNTGSIVEVNSETDFVARNIEFQDFVGSVAKISLQNNANIEDILNTKYFDSKKIFKIIDQMPMSEILKDKRIKPLNLSLFSDYNPKTTTYGLGFKDKAKALYTIKAIKNRDLKYQVNVIATMLGRAKKHPYKTKNMKEAIKVFSLWMKNYKKNRMTKF